MGSNTTITVDESTLHRFKAVKSMLEDIQDKSPDHSADSFLNVLMDTFEEVYDGDHEPGDGTGVDESEIAQQVVEDLTTQLPPAIADELEGRR